MNTLRIIIACMAVLVCAGTVAANNVTFAYQGRVKVQGNTFNGDGLFKLAIVNAPGNVTLWSNDGTSIAGSEPLNPLSVPVSVNDGVFSLLVGDTESGMLPISSVVFNTGNVIKLRVWFSDGVNGFQRLLPDSPLINTVLNILQTGTDDFTIYVNGTTGHDANSGLTAATAKKTVQAALDVLPDRIRCNVTVDIADGVYREAARVNGVSILPGKTLLIKGDEAWTPASAGDPAVRITGADNDDTHVKVRTNAFQAIQCTGISLTGIHFDYATYSGLQLENGKYNVNNCKLTNNTYGMVGTSQSEIILTNSVADNNGVHGFAMGRNSYASFTDCKARSNGYAGISMNTQCTGRIWGSGDYSSNTSAGLHVIIYSALDFGPPLSVSINNNVGYAVSVAANSYIEGLYQSGITMTGYTGNPVDLQTGAKIY